MTAGGYACLVKNSISADARANSMGSPCLSWDFWVSRRVAR